ncbi:MAG: PAS domain S-box protein [Betaproteobacteria bacterium]|nr:PAS domain S-box protein [Betaproteobacteria bacterium]
MRSATWKPALIVALLLLLLTYLWAQSRSPHLERQIRWHETARTLELYDAELMRDVLLARAGLLSNYDSLSQTGQALMRLARELRTEFGSDSADILAATTLVAPTDTLIGTLEGKLVRVEHFKSDNALLRNSVMYFHLAGRVLRSRANRRDAAQIGRLWQAMLSYINTLDPELIGEIHRDLDQLDDTPSLREQSQTLIVHGRLIVELLPRLDLLLRDIIGSSSVAEIGVLQNALQAYGQKVEATAQAFRLSLYLVAVVLVGYLLYQFVRLRTYTLYLRQAHGRLQRESMGRKQAEASLRESDERLRAMTESAHEAIISTDDAGNIVSWNRGATVMFGYATDDALNTPLCRLLSSRRHPAQPAIFAAASFTADTVELTGVHRDGSEIPLEVSLSNWSRGTARYVTAIMRDISTRKHLLETARQQELKLIQTNKMTALGTLVSGVAHEINNPNHLILMNSGILADVWNDAREILDIHAIGAGAFKLGGLPYDEMRESLPQLIKNIRDGASRIERIVADLKNFARPRKLGEPAVFSLNEAVEHAMRLLNHLIGRKTARFQTRLAEHLPPIRGDAQQAEQIIVNLLVNALEALPDPSCGVSLSTFAVAAARSVGLEVRDEGIGIAPEHLEHLCDPFFTTKQEQGGTGLGLAITASLVRTHGGRLSFSSEPGKGTCVRVWFPEELPQDSGENVQAPALSELRMPFPQEPPPQVYPAS